MAQRRSQPNWQILTAFLARAALCLAVAPAAWAGEVGRPLSRPAPGAGAPPPACRYTVTVLQSPFMCGSNPENLTVKAINANGDIAGERWCSPDNRRPFFIPAGGSYQAWANPEGVFDLSVESLNESGEITGRAQFATAPIRGYLRKPNGEYLILGFPPAGTYSAAYCASGSSLVMGAWGNQQTGPGYVPCIWQDGVMTDLSSVLGAPQGEVMAANARGWMTGWAGTSWINDANAFILKDGRLTVLPDVPGATTSTGFAINEHGDVCGRGWLPGSGWQAFAYLDGQMIGLGTLPGQPGAIAYALNNSKVIVGSSAKAFVWQNGVMRILNDLIPAQPAYTLKIGRGIHDDGRIVVSGTLGGVSGPIRSFLLTPIYPSPADLNLDCQVNGIDLAMLLGAWGPIGSAPDASADLNQDGVVNGIDLALLLGEWG